MIGLTKITCKVSLMCTHTQTLKLRCITVMSVNLLVKIKYFIKKKLFTEAKHKLQLFCSRNAIETIDSNIQRCNRCKPFHN